MNWRANRGRMGKSQKSAKPYGRATPNWIPQSGIHFSPSLSQAKDHPSINVRKILDTTNDETQVLNKYLFYFYKIAKWNISEGGTIQRLYNDNLKKTKVPVPFPNRPDKSLAEQERIVAILDKFDALTNSISEGLPREIELRQQQYEYYRNMLLNFPKQED